MWAIAIAAGSAALFFAQVALLRRWLGVSWTRSGTARSTFGVFLFVLMAAALGPLGALVVGVASNVFLGGRMLQQSRRALRVQRLLTRLRQPNDDPSGVLAALEHEVEGIRGGRGGEKGTYEARARWVLAIAAAVAEAGHHARAVAWLGGLEPEVLGRYLAAMHAQYEAAFRLALGDREGARRAIARAPRPAMPPWEGAFQAFEGVLEALEGDAATSVERSTRALAETSPSAGAARVTWQMARAHALVRIGDVTEARETLESVRQEAGDRPLERVVAHDGPASRLAEAVLGERGAYR
jgi:hypothetical protein